MANSMSSATKVAFITTVTEAILDTQKKTQSAMDTIKAVTDKAQYAATDRVYNTMAQMSNNLGEAFQADKKVLAEIAEELTHRTDVGTAFVANAKKALAEVESIPKMAEYSAITAERDGNETWDNGMAGQLNDAIEQWNKARFDFINSFADGFKKIEEEEFRASVKPIGSKNEEFTNSLARALNRIQDALDELGISIDKFQANVSSASSSTSIDSADSIKPDLMGADV